MSEAATETQISSSHGVPGESRDEQPTADKPVVLRGTARGLEIWINESIPLYQVMADLEARVAQSPEFFQGSDVTLHVGTRQFPHGGLAHLKAITDRYEMKIVRLETDRPETVQSATNLQIPTAAPPTGAAAASQPDVLNEPMDAARLVAGPLRSGAVVSSHHHVVVVGDVNAGAEIRAAGNIVVLGSLRGLAHAALGGDDGFIVALRLQPQQLRIGGLIARAGESDAGVGAEIAYAQGGRIVVEPFLGKLPMGLWGSKRT